jgi:hypothetical protein
VGIEASGSVYVTELRGTLHLLLAQALGGDVRITVHETTPDPTPLPSTGLFLGTILFAGTSVKRGSGSFLADGFVTGETLRVGGGTAYDGDYAISAVSALEITLATSTGAVSDTVANVHLRASAPRRHLDLLQRLRPVRGERPARRPHGRIAATGSVLLRIGDNVTTTSNSQIEAGTTIDVYGDWTNADAGYGTTIDLRGDITGRHRGLGKRRRRHLPARLRRQDRRLRARHRAGADALGEGATCISARRPGSTAARSPRSAAAARAERGRRAHDPSVDDGETASSSPTCSRWTTARRSPSTARPTPTPT